MALDLTDTLVLCTVTPEYLLDYQLVPLYEGPIQSQRRNENGPDKTIYRTNMELVHICHCVSRVGKSLNTQFTALAVD